tara:strand:+ start:18113 stop:18379 length:267 start_codon:yes stop_codon:yes gene_type:complete
MKPFKQFLKEKRVESNDLLDELQEIYYDVSMSDNESGYMMEVIDFLSDPDEEDPELALDSLDRIKRLVKKYLGISKFYELVDFIKSYQ